MLVFIRFQHSVQYNRKDNDLFFGATLYLPKRGLSCLTSFISPKFKARVIIKVGHKKACITFIFSVTLTDYVVMTGDEAVCVCEK